MKVRGEWDCKYCTFEMFTRLAVSIVELRLVVCYRVEANRKSRDTSDSRRVVVRENSSRTVLASPVHARLPHLCFFSVFSFFLAAFPNVA